MATANLGRVGFVNKGTYSGSTAYKVNDVVVYNSGTYACIQANTGQAPTNTSYWQNWVADSAVHKTGDETIAGVKTFSSSPIVPNATTATQSIAYGQAVKNTGDETIEGIKSFSDGVKVQNQNVSPFSGFKNYIINGNFDVWQYGTSQASAGYGSDDRWRNENVGSTKTHSKVACTDTERALFSANSFSRTIVTSVAGAGNYVLKQQKIEDVTKLAGKTVTLSFWAKADSNKNINITFSQTFGSGGSPSATVGNIGTQTIALTTTWQEKSITVTLPSIVGKTIGTDGAHTSFTGIAFWFEAGSNFISTFPTITQQSGTFDIAQVQLEEGSVATPFEQRPYGLELSLCQRYYEDGADSWGGGSSRWTGYAISGVGYSATTKYKVRKRIPPTIVLSNVYASGFPSTIGTVNGGLDGFAEDRVANATSNSATFVSSFTASAEL